ncbi:MAG: bifunctional hydroxymethylpyrimidine kinase/phosphomethylpyrimidine kinase, partial [Actinobacteria bacterium]|nr:bifunctional hydroxymethylpyrimidine kinase/phosphomethylpyrimidine kinase [Actinomycetota bacterium]
KLLRSVDVLVPNAGELAELAGADPAGDHGGVVDRARSVRGPGAVVVTLGADGALVVTGKGSEHVPAPSVRAVDTTAAGDCFCGALADALARGLILVDAARWAVAASSLSVGRKGAQASLPTANEVRAAAVSGD